MIDYHRFCQSKHVHEQQGLNASQIATAVAPDRRTVAYWLPQAHFRPRIPRPSVSQLDPFKPAMVRLLERYPYSAAQVFQGLREQGFAGSYELVNA
jgi:transposase